MTDNYIHAAKNSSLYKKFVQGRNKSFTTLTPKINDVKISTKENKIDSEN